MNTWMSCLNITQAGHYLFPPKKKVHMLRIKRDQLVGAILVVAGVFIFASLSRFSVPFTAAYPGPRMLPGIAAFGFVVCGAGIFVQGTLSKKEQKPFLIPAGWARMGICLAVLIVYVFLMKYLHFLIVTPVCTYVLTTLFARGYKSTLKGRILFSVVMTSS